MMTDAGFIPEHVYGRCKYQPKVNESMTKSELLQHLRRLIDEAGTQKDLAVKLGVSPTYLGDVLLGRKEPGKKLLDALGFERVVIYRKVGQPC